MTAQDDEEDRKRAVCERDRNVIVEASAGTGKTSLIVDRLVELVAPTDGRDPIRIDRIAAISFTRKAAGELRVRLRQRLLQAIANTGQNTPRMEMLLRALGGIDTAHVGTVHGFADSLLRKWPAQAKLDAQYELDDRSDALVDECFEVLVHAAERGTLTDLLVDRAALGVADEATTAILDLQRAGIRLRSHETEHWTYHGLDNLIRSIVQHREVSVPEPAETPFDARTFQRFAAEFLRWTDGISRTTAGGRWLVETATIVRRQLEEPDPVVIFRELVQRLERGPRGRASDAPRRAHDFDEDDRAWEAWKAFAGDTTQNPVRESALREDLLGPLRHWMAVRLVRLRPVILAVYEQVKARHRVVDHVDLLLRLRDLLRHDHDVRRASQNLFDHIFVDEFQDTDPLQSEIVMFLGERGASAASWDTVSLAPGVLTVVGDPKQSIYRFRRADIATYEQALDVIRRSPHVTARLTRSFRSVSGLVDWVNDRFGTILGTGDRTSGAVRYQPLTRGPRTGADPAVHVVPIDMAEDADAAESRALEAVTMARYLRWLVCVSGMTVVDPIRGAPRPLSYGDIGVLAISTTNLRVLFDALDRDDVPYASRGGTLFLGDPLHRRFLLGLCALADRDDGVAVAALLRPPFFAVGLADLARARGDAPDDPAGQARAIVRELRRRRFERGVGATARALLDETAIGRMAALGPNGMQRLAALRELCFRIELRASEEQLDFDGVMQVVRSWVEHPTLLDPPHPIGRDAVRVMTVHQAKGLEFPVAVMWDGRATWHDRNVHDAWMVERNGAGWTMRLDSLKWDEPPGRDLAARERAIREAERKRLVYVAATRARDVLIVPKHGSGAPRSIAGTLLAGRPMPTIIERPVHAAEHPAAWFAEAAPLERAGSVETTTRDVELRQAWAARAAEAGRERLSPIAFTDATAPRVGWHLPGRFGTVFGEVVHVAIGLALRTGCAARDAVRRGAPRAGLTTHVEEAISDVERALATLAEIGIRVAGDCELEYPISGVTRSGHLVSGYVDLLAADAAVLLDFKTDRPPLAGEPIAQRYVDQVTGYAAAIERSLSLQVRAGLLFTADGGIRWLSGGDNGSS